MTTRAPAVLKIVYILVHLQNFDQVCCLQQLPTYQVHKTVVCLKPFCVFLEFSFCSSPRSVTAAVCLFWGTLCCFKIRCCSFVFRYFPTKCDSGGVPILRSCLLFQNSLLLFCISVFPHKVWQWRCAYSEEGPLRQSSGSNHPGPHCFCLLCISRFRISYCFNPNFIVQNQLSAINVLSLNCFCLLSISVFRNLQLVISLR